MWQKSHRGGWLSSWKASLFWDRQVNMYKIQQLQHKQKTPFEKYEISNDNNKNNERKSKQ